MIYLKSFKEFVCPTNAKYGRAFAAPTKTKENLKYDNGFQVKYRDKASVLLNDKYPKPYLAAENLKYASPFLTPNNASSNASTNIEWPHLKMYIMCCQELKMGRHT